MKTLLPLLVALVATGLSAQPLERARVGLVLQGSFDMHHASFKQLPDLGNCCPGFTGGSGGGWLVGASFLSPLNDQWTLDVRAGYQSGSVDMQETESKLIVQPSGVFESATIRHDLSATFARLAVEPMAVYAIAPNVGLKMGLFGAYQMSSTFRQAEVLQTPSNAVFENGQRSRNQAEGDISSAAALNLGLTVGIGTELPLDVDRVFTMSPELLVTYAPTSLVSDISWTKTMIRAGVVISYSPIEEEEPISDFELFEIARTTLLRPTDEARPVLVPTVRVSSLSDNGTVLDRSQIRIEEFASTRIRPLLPYVFFDEQSYALSPRYRQLSREQVEAYSLSNFYNLDAMVTYYQVLNVLGRRLQEKPDATITLTGCTDSKESQSSEDLGKRRAQVVKNYLVDTWGVSASRIAVEGRGLPSAASNESEADGASENRRVEIVSSDPSLLSAVESKDTMRVFDPPALRFSPSLSDTSRVKQWTVFVSESDRIIRTFHGTGAPPSAVDWRIEEQSRLLPRGIRNVEYMVVVQDSNGTVIPSETATVPVTERTLAEKGSSGGTDKTVDRYSLILFGFDRSELTDQHKLLIDNVKTRLTPTSKVSITGYTDRTGSDDYNLRLSEQRARAVATGLGVQRATITGQGEKLPLYNNDTPEGRFYSRTVEIVVETPLR